MKRLFVNCLLLTLISLPARSQNFSDDFDQTPASDFASSSADWEAVWSGDGWTTAVHSGGVSPSTEVSGPGEFGAPADAFENAIVTGEDSWRDYSIETRFFVDDIDGLGFVFRYTSPDSFYVLVLSRNLIPAGDGQVDVLVAPETRLYRVHAGVATQILDPIPAAAYADSGVVAQNLRIEVAASTIKIWHSTGVNEIDAETTPLAEVEDIGSAPTAGKAGLYAFSLGGSGSYFDDFRVRPLDSDNDGKNNDDEHEAGTDPFDADSDDDGVPDGSEFDWLGDADSDGDINAMDWDADNDGLPDGLELGVTEPDDDTDLSAGHFTADEDPSTTTNHREADSDSGGVSDGGEDLNGNGRYESNLGETDPNDGEDDGDFPDAGSGDGGADGDTDSDSDADADTDTDTDTDTDLADAGTDTDASTGADDAGAEWGGLFGGPNCNCATVGRGRDSIGSKSVGLLHIVVRLFKSH